MTYIANAFLKPIVDVVTHDSDDPESDEAWRNLDFEKIAKQVCENMTSEERRNMHYESVGECTTGMKDNILRMAITIGLVFFIMWISIFIHFCLVLYTNV